MLHTLAPITEKISINESGEFVLRDEDPFPLPLLVIASRLLQIITDEINRLYAQSMSVSTLVNAHTGEFPFVGRVIFFIFVKKNLNEFMAHIHRLFPFEKSYYATIQYKEKMFLEENLYEKLIQNVRSRFNRESLHSLELVEAYEKLLLMQSTIELKHAQLFRKLKIDETAHALFSFLAEAENGGYTRDAIRAQNRIRELVWCRMWISVILKEMYGDKISYKKIGEIVSADPKNHASIIHYVRRHKKWIEKNAGYAHMFYELRGILMHQLNQTIGAEKFLEILSKNGIQMKLDDTVFVSLMAQEVLFSPAFVSKFFAERGIHKVKI